MTHPTPENYSREYLQSLTPALCKQIARSLGLKPRFHKRRVISQIRNEQIFQQVERETRQLIIDNDLEMTIENRWKTIQTKDGLMISTSPYWGLIGCDIKKWLQGQADMKRPARTLELSLKPQATLKNGIVNMGKIYFYVSNAADLIESLQMENWQLIEIRVTAKTKTIRHRGHEVLSEPTYYATAIYESKNQRRKDGKLRRWAKRISMKTWMQLEVQANQKIVCISANSVLPVVKYPTQNVSISQPSQKNLSLVGAGNEKDLSLVGAGDETENYRLYF